MSLNTGMHHTWTLLSSAWYVVVITYLALYIFTEKRLKEPAKKRSGITFWVVAVLAVLRTAIRYILGRGLIYQFAALFGGIAAGVAALDLARLLMEQKPDDATTGKEERIQSLKLS